MNERQIIPLRSFMASDDGWGTEEGRVVNGKLLQFVEKHPEAVIFVVSLTGVRRTDASFPRESVMELARRFRNKLGFCLIDIENEDLLDNWDAAAEKKEQPMTYWNPKGSPRQIGKRASQGNQALLTLVQTRFETRAVDAAENMGLKLTNVSTKLKQLWEQGFILRREEAADSGGIEFVYFPIR